MKKFDSDKILVRRNFFVALVERGNFLTGLYNFQIKSFSVALKTTVTVLRSFLFYSESLFLAIQSAKEKKDPLAFCHRFCFLFRETKARWCSTLQFKAKRGEKKAANISPLAPEGQLEGTATTANSV